jgi:hypothetical protein
MPNGAALAILAKPATAATEITAKVVFFIDVLLLG